MRRLVVLAALAFSLASAPAGAALLNWEGTLDVRVSADLPLITETGGGVATVNDSAGILPAHLNTLRLKASRGNIAGTQTVFLTDPETSGNSVSMVIVSAHLGTGTFAPVSGGTLVPLTQNVLPVRGLAKICLFDTSCTQFLPLLLTQPTTPTGTAVKGVGVGGSLTAGGGTGGVQVTIEAAPWTLMTASADDEISTPSGQTFILLTTTGFAHGPASAASTTAALSGVVRLVSPAQVRTNLLLGSNAKVAVLIGLTVHFIPEPGILLLLGSSVLGLALLGRHRLR